MTLYKDKEMKEKHGKLKDEHVLHRKNGINSGAGKLFVSYFFFMHDINYEINNNKKRKNNVCLRTKLFDNRDGSPRLFFGLSLFLFGPHIFIVFSTYFICCSYLHSNKITSIQSGTFNDLPNLYVL